MNNPSFPLPKLEDGTLSASESIADSVEQHLLGLENSAPDHQATQSFEEQPLNAEMILSTVNEGRLQALLTQSDEFLGYISGELDSFEVVATNETNSKDTQ